MTSRGGVYPIHRMAEKECKPEERAEMSTLVDEHCGQEGWEVGLSGRNATTTETGSYGAGTRGTAPTADDYGDGGSDSDSTSVERNMDSPTPGPADLSIAGTVSTTEMRETRATPSPVLTTLSTGGAHKVTTLYSATGSRANFQHHQGVCGRARQVEGVPVRCDR